MNSHQSLLMAQSDWGQALEPESVCVLDETRGILACRVMVSGKSRQVLQQGPLRMILTGEIISKLAAWNETPQAFQHAAQRSRGEQEGE